MLISIFTLSITDVGLQAAVERALGISVGGLTVPVREGCASWYSWCRAFFTFAVIKYYERKRLEKKGIILACKSMFPAIIWGGQGRGT